MAIFRVIPDQRRAERGSSTTSVRGFTRVPYKTGCPHKAGMTIFP
ncbi:hypothetical protein [Micavibrio aeruginosavorus]|uniref:Uncharacterized protein n=1 Tax=Micavibrio aeruginosavorus EPB TaxID=349215 RepID=M4VHQ1_9BACT|nr:hypothetical protein [Micavibrio aeruginosavorus]AGH97566.1 hypothetical protein A11S_743 [Micavibrio aeruginosavorus EPB]